MTDASYLSRSGNVYKSRLPTAAEALPGRSRPVALAHGHLVNGRRLRPPFPQGMELAVFGMGCFWGAERRFWQREGVYVTAAGYAGGFTPNPGYEEVCSGRTGHAEVVLVVYDPSVVSFASLLQLFWESHDPTQGMRQGNDLGTQYRSVIYCSNRSQMQLAARSLEVYQHALANKGFAAVTTEVGLLAADNFEPAAAAGAVPVNEGCGQSEQPGGHRFFYAEDYHQQYLARNPGGYCGLRGTGVSCAL